MLSELRIENFAIIQELELSFQPGLTTFTGETGAGKSIILDAIVALLGGRVDSTLIRAGAERASVEGVFTIPAANRSDIHALLEGEDLLDDPDSVELGRELRQNGRSVARVNGRSVSVSLLRELGEYLVDIHGQSEHLSLLNVRQHVRLLDQFANAGPALEAYRGVYRELRQAQKELDGLRQMEKDAARKTDLLQFQVEEIESAHLKTDEEDGLRQERNRLANTENIRELSGQALGLLEEGGPETPAVSDLIGQAAQALEGLSRIDPALAELANQVLIVEESLADTVRELRRYLDGLDVNPQSLVQVEERLDLIQRLKRKYGGSIEAALQHAASARRELEQITHAGERIEELERQITLLRGRLAGLGKQLSDLRGAAVVKLARAVEAELNDLSMAGAHFAVELQIEADEDGLELPDGRKAAFDESGLDRVEFLIAPNPGEGLKPLVKIASGGETSRLMLALKKVLTQADSIPTLIFDEIDQGIGGRVGTVVGEKLWQLSRKHQVLCVTHLPQLAAYGDQHYSVRKRLDSGRTATQVEPLDGDSRLIELAQMIGAVTEVNLNAARETLASARERASYLVKQKIV